MYFLAKLQPNLKEPGDFFTVSEKKRQIDQFYAQRQHIPLCIDHCNAPPVAGFVVPERDRIGRVVDLLTNRQGDLLVKLVLDQSHEAYARINKSIALDHQKWGVSVWIDTIDSGTRQQGVYKQLTHVALTTDPYFAKHNTFLHKWQLQEAPLDRIIARELYAAGEGDSYAHPSLVDKLKAVADFDSRQRIRHGGPLNTVTVTPPAMDQQETQQSSATDEQSMEHEEERGDELEPPMKRRRLENDAQGQQQKQAVGMAGGLPSLESINMSDPRAVKEAKRLYDTHLDKSEVPLHRQDRDFRKIYDKLDDVDAEHNKTFQKHLTNLRTGYGYDDQPDLTNEFVPTQTFLTFAAANSMLGEANEKKIKEKDSIIRRKDEELKHLRSLVPSESSSAKAVGFADKASAATTPRQSTGSVDLGALDNDKSKSSRTLNSTYYKNMYQEPVKKNPYARSGTVVDEKYLPLYHDLVPAFQAKVSQRFS